MRRDALVTEEQAQHALASQQRRFAAYLGAGAAVEAGVPTTDMICNEIRAKMLSSDDPTEIERVEKELRWNERSSRYLNCIQKRFPNKYFRLDFFRRQIRGIRPSFCHHAIALLKVHEYLRPVSLTTNFDKLLELAFAEQGSADCQPLRSFRETKYYDEQESRYFVLKLHGDCDTENILNTDEETRLIRPNMIGFLSTYLRRSGLVVLGSAGYEKSVHTLFDNLLAKDPSEILTYGLYWGVFMGSGKPADPSSEAVMEKLSARIDEVISPEIRKAIEGAVKRGFEVAFFPNWGSGDFLEGVTRLTGNAKLLSASRGYLDHEMRVREDFRNAGLSYAAVDSHLEHLRKKKLELRTSERPQQVRKVFTAKSKSGSAIIEAVYADIASYALLGNPEDGKRAVVSPDDTTLSAGGGVAQSLLEGAGPKTILNELSKIRRPVPVGEVVVTSGGNLPAHYIFHCAPLRVFESVPGKLEYELPNEGLTKTIEALVRVGAALGVETIFLPLIGSGAGPLGNEESLGCTLDAFAGLAGESATKLPRVVIVIWSEERFHRNSVLDTLKARLPQQFEISKTG